MKIFSNRFDKKYRKILLERLQFDGQNGLINTAIEEVDPNGSKNEFGIRKICRIELCGIAATTLFDKGGDYNKSNIPVAKQFYYVLDNLKKLNDLGIKLQLRLLFLYPYSESSITRVHAEISEERSTISNPSFSRGFNYASDINPSVFSDSTISKNQTHSLRVLQSYLKEFGLLDKNNINEISIRFALYGLNTCCLFINEVLFFDSYTLAKKDIADNDLVSISPLTMIDKMNSQKDREIFMAYEDHFRYLWHLDSTLYYEDATKFDIKKYTGLSSVKMPKEINYQHKAKAISEYPIYSKFSPDEKQNLMNDWKFKMEFYLRKLTINLREVPTKEKLFIACSWVIGDQGQRIPNHYAEDLQRWLKADFEEKADPFMFIDYVKSGPGDRLSEKLYHDLEAATLAIVLVTKDIESEGKSYCRPNIPHELGYLMKNLEGTKRVLIFYEDGVARISNVADTIHGSFNENNFKQSYLNEVLHWLDTCGIHLNKTYLDQARIRQSLVIAGIKE